MICIMIIRRILPATCLETRYEVFKKVIYYEKIIVVIFQRIMTTCRCAYSAVIILSVVPTFNKNIVKEEA